LNNLSVAEEQELQKLEAEFGSKSLTPEEELELLTLESDPEIEEPDPFGRDEFQADVEHPEKDIIKRGFAKRGLGDVDVETGATFGKRLNYALSNRFTEIQKKFLDKYPKGEIIRVELGESVTAPEEEKEVGPVLAFKKSKSDKQYTLVNPVGMDAGDWAKLAADVPEIAATIGAIIATRGKSLMVQSGAAGVATTVADLAMEGVEAYRGYQEDPIESILGEASIKGATTATMTGAIGAGEKLFRAGRQVRLGGIDKDAQKVVRALKEEGLLEKIPADLLTRDKAVRRILAQTRASSDVLQADERAVMEAVKQKLKTVGGGKTAQEAGRVLRDQLTPQALETAKYQILAPGGIAEETFRQAGRSINTAFIKKIKTDARISSRLFNRAKAMFKEEPVFDLKATAAEANGIGKGVMARVIKKSAASKVKISGAREFPTSLEALAKEDAKTALAAGVKKETVLSINSSLKRVVDAIKKAGELPQSFETVKRLRTELGELRQASKVTGMNNTERLANNLYFRLTDSMRNPISGNKAAVDAWRKASDFHFRKETQAQKQYFRDWVKTEEPTNLAKMYAAPGKTDALYELKETIGVKQFNKLQSAFESDLLQNSSEITKTLQSFSKDREALKILLPGNRVKLYERMGQAIDDLNKGPLASTARKNLEDGAFALDLVKNRGPEGLKEILKTFGKNQKQAKELMRDAVIDDLFMGSLSRDTFGRWFVDPKKLASKIGGYKTAETNRSLNIIFARDEIRALGNLDKINNLFAYTVSDMGASLQVHADIGAIISGARGNVVGAAKGALDLGFRRTIGKFVQTDVGRHFLLSQRVILPQKNYTILKALSASAINARDGVSEVSQAIGQELRIMRRNAGDIEEEDEF